MNYCMLQKQKLKISEEGKIRTILLDLIRIFSTHLETSLLPIIWLKYCRYGVKLFIISQSMLAVEGYKFQPMLGIHGH